MHFRASGFEWSVSHPPILHGPLSVSSCTNTTKGLDDFRAFGFERCVEPENSLLFDGWPVADERSHGYVIGTSSRFIPGRRRDDIVAEADDVEQASCPVLIVCKSLDVVENMRSGTTTMSGWWHR